MHVFSTRGIALHYLKYSENSVIVRIYTEKFGLQSFLVRGSRKAKSSRKVNLFRYLTPLELVIYHRPDRDLQFIKEISPAANTEAIFDDPAKSAVTIFLAEVISKSVKEHEPDRELFRFLMDGVNLLCDSKSNTAVINLFILVHLTKYLGFFPSDNFSSEKPFFHPDEGLFKEQRSAEFGPSGRQTGAWLHNLINSEKNTVIDLLIPLQEREELFATLLSLYRHQLPGFKSVKSYEVLKAIF